VSLPGALSELDRVLDAAFADLAALVGEASKTSDFGGTEYGVVERRMRRRMEHALDAYSKGTIGVDELENEWASAIAGAYPKAYELGARQWGETVDAEDRAWIERAVRSEAGYASNFAAQLENGEQAIGGAAARLGLYIDALASVKTAAWVRKAPDDTLFRWVAIGDGATCSDCLTLDSHSPYLRDDLPCQPRSGCTACLGSCRCVVEIVGAGDVPPSPQVEDLEATASGVRTDGSEPTAEERARIDDLRAQINYQRRRIAEARTDAERDAAIAARKQANKELVDFERERGIRSVPMLSVGEVLSGTDISPAALDGLLARGIDGTTLALSDAADARRAALDIQRRVKDLLK